MHVVEHREERVRWLEEVERGRAVVHRDGVGRGELADDRGGRLGVERGPAPDGDEQHVDVAERRTLLGA